MALATPPNDRKRVKVYELRENDWFDRGTGFCMGQVIDVRSAFRHRLSASGRAQTATNVREPPRRRTASFLPCLDEPRIYVESEDQPERTLLETRIGKEESYQKQQG
ncbi:hypothetical protein Egran_00466 [Elaphomyces granulatus]|uniref:PP4R3 EVH1-like domain-containing protein n=1 Tax=Elaphomyces granulatus TaxID=519963 RepID=A0A232M5V4_9EURO|nr:hypothetical protein Egran_00466 [Elaphomyces granulatus]